VAAGWLGDVEISALYVRPEARRGGIAIRALDAAHRATAQSGGEGFRIADQSAWQQAVAFYARRGFWVQKWQHSLVFCRSGYLLPYRVDLDRDPLATMPQGPYTPPEFARYRPRQPKVATIVSTTAPGRTSTISNGCVSNSQDVVNRSLQSGPRFHPFHQSSEVALGHGSNLVGRPRRTVGGGSGATSDTIIRLASDTHGYDDEDRSSD
jgi:hypothetical protein